MNSYLKPNWPAPPQVRAYTSLRHSGFSKKPYNSFNLGLTTGDDPRSVLQNRQKLVDELKLKNEPCWLQQAHTNQACRVEEIAVGTPIIADASCTQLTNQACVVLTADCLPILICDQQGTRVAALHGGWRGILSGIIENTLALLHTPNHSLMAWLGPAIGPQAFQVGAEVMELFINVAPENATAFQPVGDKYLANLYQLARLSLHRAGIQKIYGGEYCTFSQSSLFYSYRRDGKLSGRMASLIWLEP